MCLIVNNPAGRPLNEIRMRAAYDNNRDGVGVMWHDSDGSVRSTRGLMTFKEFWELHQMLLDTPHAIHFRLKTRGRIHEDACHPFQILNAKEDGLDLYMMHNGTLHGLPADDKESDTMIFARELRKKIRTWDDPMEILSPVLLGKLAKNIGSGNKFLFFGTGGVTRIVNSKAGWFDSETEGALEIDTHDGNQTPVWYSNQYSFYGLDPDTWYTTPLPPKPVETKVVSSDTGKWYNSTIVPPATKKEETVRTGKMEFTSTSEWSPSKYPVVVRRQKDGSRKPVRWR